MARLVVSSGMWIKRFNRGNAFEETCFERKTLIKQDASATCQIFIKSAHLELKSKILLAYKQPILGVPQEWFISEMSLSGYTFTHCEKYFSWPGRRVQWWFDHLALRVQNVATTNIRMMRWAMGRHATISWGKSVFFQ